MKVTDYFDLLRSHGSHKKNSTLIPSIDGFFRHVTSSLSGRQLVIRIAGAGLLVGLMNLNKQSWPAPAPFIVFDFAHGGRMPGFLLTQSPFPLAGRRFFLCHFLKEYIVTLTDNIRRIEELSNHVIVYADAREYEQAHIALDDIESKVHAVRDHIDHLQEVSPRVPVSAGDNCS